MKRDASLVIRSREIEHTQFLSRRYYEYKYFHLAGKSPLRIFKLSRSIGMVYVGAFSHAPYDYTHKKP